MTTEEQGNVAAKYPYRAALREAARDAVRYWEPRRLRFNAVLTAVSIVAAIVALLFGPEWASFENWILYVPLAVIANILYSVVYVVDLPLQFSAFCGAWRRRGRRYVFVAATVVLSLLAFELSFFTVAPLIPD